MNNGETINIGYSKLHGLAALLSALCMVALGVWRIVDPIAYSSVSRTIIGSIAVGFLVAGGGITIFFSLRYLFSKSPLLAVSDEGIASNGPGNNLGFVPWSDVLEIKTKRIFLQNFLIIILRNPEEFINKQTSTRKKFTTSANFRQTGSPFIISLGALMGSAEELQKLVIDKFEAYKSKLPQGVSIQA